MEGVVFWIFVLIAIIINVLKTKSAENESMKPAQQDETVWQDISDFLQNGPKERTTAKRPKRQTASNYTEPVDFQAYEVKTGSAMADLIPIWEAAGRGKYEIVEEKLAAGVNVNEPDTFFGETALHRAAKAGDLDMVRLLLTYGARVDVTDQYGETPLHFAIRGHNPDVIRLLLEQGADPDWEDIFGRTPAHCARFYTDLRDCFAGSTPT